MARFAPVAPIQVLEALYDQDPHLLGDYHLLLAHHVSQEAERFSRLFRRIEEDGELYPLVLMDNSLVELKGAVDLDMMQRACEAINQGNATTIVPVLPDVYRKGAETRIAIADAYDEWGNRLLADGSCEAVMAVLQGETMDEFATTLEFVTSLSIVDIGWWGIPRVLVEQHGSRVEATEFVISQAIPRGTQIHLLGFSDDMEDDIRCAKMKGIDGIDSAVPMRITQPFDPRHVPEPRDPTWFETAELTPEMVENLNHVRNLVRGG
jgi:hypothetical protein